jgi:hypothetical protein
MPLRDISQDSNNDIVNIAVSHDKNVTLIFNGIYLYVHIKTATLSEHYTQDDTLLCEDCND